jgi:hypothetical protein
MVGHPWMHENGSVVFAGASVEPELDPAVGGIARRRCGTRLRSQGAAHASLLNGDRAPHEFCESGRQHRRFPFGRKKAE